MSLKVNNIKEWLLYVEDDKTKAFDITLSDTIDELKELCKDAGIPIIGYVSFEREADAIGYGEQILRN